MSVTSERIDGAFMARFPRLEIVSSFGVGYDHVEVAWAAAHGVTVTNTPDVLTEEVADTALGLLLCTVREFPQAERYLRAGKWVAEGLSAQQGVAARPHGRAGRHGPHRAGDRAPARGHAGAGGLPFAAAGGGRVLPALSRTSSTWRARSTSCWSSRRAAPATRNLINAEVLAALGPKGILINMARGSVVDEPALIKALEDKTIMSAGLDVYANEPEVPPELIAMDHVVLFPHLGSASVATRERMDQLVVDNLLAWAAGKGPLTPVPETPWPPKTRP